MKRLRISIVVFFIASISIFTNATLVDASTLPPSFCHTFDKDLKSGATGAHVLALELILVDHGFLKNSYVGGPYNSAVANAVILFQQKYASAILTPNKLRKGTGVVGNSTRAKLNEMYGCPSSDSKDISSILKNNPQVAAIINALPNTTPTPTPVVTLALPPIEIVNTSHEWWSLSRNRDNEPTSASVVMRFSVINRTDDPLFINTNPSLAFSTITNLDNVSAATTFLMSRDTVSITPANAFYIAPKSKRSFEVGALLNNRDGRPGTTDAFITINRIFYSSTTENIARTSEAKSFFTDAISSGSIRLGRE